MPLIIDLKTTSIFNAVIDIDFPPNLVGDSEFIKLQVIGKTVFVTTKLKKLQRTGL